MNSLLSQIGHYDIISFDIFDTVLCRTVSKPDQVFLEIGKRFVEVFPKYTYSPNVFQYLRKKAERDARKGKEEITLKEIYANMPWSEEEKEKAYQIELDLELQHTYLNPEMLDFINTCVAKGKRIILVSDMYLNKNQIEHLLVKNGFDLNVVEQLFVSSEYGVSKNSGRLFKHLKEIYPNERILHIGDNYTADYIKARQNDIIGIHYDRFTKNNELIFDMEKSLVDSSVSSIESLRKVLKTDNPLYNIGTQVLGPVLNTFVEWVIDYCMQHRVNEIRPLMREGYLFTEILKRAITYKGLDIQVKPLYVSRKSTYLFDKENIDIPDIQQLLWRQHFKVKDLFELLQLEQYPDWLEKYQDNYIEDLNNVTQFDNELKERLHLYLTSEATISEIRHIAKRQKEYFGCYVNQSSLNKEFVTIDLGYNGTIQSQLDKALKDYRLHHLILAGGEGFKACLYKGLSFSTFLGSYEDNPKFLKKIIKGTQVLESIINIPEGSTNSYTLKNEQIVPILDEVIYPDSYKEQQQICWEGIYKFQKNWLALIEQKPDVKIKILQSREGILSILYRFLVSPLNEEATAISEFVQHESFKFSRVNGIIKSSDIKLLENFGIDRFLNVTKKVYFPYDVIWPEGTIAKTYPLYFINKHTQSILSNDESLSDLYEQLKRKLTVNNEKAIYIYGAGEMGEKIAKILSVMNLEYKGFIDRNAAIMENVFLNKACVTLDDFKEQDCQIIVASFAFKNQIADDLNKKFSESKYAVDIILFET